MWAVTDVDGRPAGTGRRHAERGGATYTGTLVFDVLLGDVRSLKQKRSVVRPIVAELRRRYEVAAAEVGALEMHRRAEIGVAVVSAEARHVREVLDACERLVAGRPEIELLSAHRQLRSSTDEETVS